MTTLDKILMYLVTALLAASIILSISSSSYTDRDRVASGDLTRLLDRIEALEDATYQDPQVFIADKTVDIEFSSTQEGPIDTFVTARELANAFTQIADDGEVVLERGGIYFWEVMGNVRCQTGQAFSGYPEIRLQRANGSGFQDLGLPGGNDLMSHWLIQRSLISARYVGHLDAGDTLRSFIGMTWHDTGSAPDSVAVLTDATMYGYLIQ